MGTKLDNLFNIGDLIIVKKGKYNGELHEISGIGSTEMQNESYELKGIENELFLYHDLKLFMPRIV